MEDMKRITEKGPDGHWRIKRFTETLPAYWQACNRLAAYENTGLTPHEVTELLRAQVEPEKNVPLTLEELREMDGEPVWVRPKEKNGGVWAFVDTECGLVRIFGTHERGRTFGICRHFEAYGKTWLAYRRKPEEAKRPEAVKKRREKENPKRLGF